MGVTCSAATDIQVKSKKAHITPIKESYISYSTHSTEHHDITPKTSQQINKMKRLLKFTFYRYDPYVWKMKCQLHSCIYLTLQLGNTDKSWSTISEALSHNNTVKYLTLFAERANNEFIIDHQNNCEYALNSVWNGLTSNQCIEEISFSNYCLELVEKLNLRLPSTIKKISVLTLSNYDCFCNTLKNNPHIAELKCVRIDLKENIYYLKDALIGMKELSVLDIGSNCIGEFGAKDVADIIKQNKAITALLAWGNQFGDNGLKRIVEGALCNTNLARIDLSTNKISNDSCIMISKLLQEHPLKVLNLSNNDINSIGINKICEGLKNSKLEELILESNLIDDDGITYLSKSLKHNKCLITLNMQSNLFTDKACSKLIKLQKSTDNSIKHILVTNENISDATVLKLSQHNK